MMAEGRLDDQHIKHLEMIQAVMRRLGAGRLAGKTHCLAVLGCFPVGHADEKAVPCPGQ